MKEFLDEDADNVVAVHCKAGKDRSAFAVAAYLLIQEGLPAAFCPHALKNRVDNHGNPIANLTEGRNKDQMVWANREAAQRWHASGAVRHDRV